MKNSFFKSLSRIVPVVVSGTVLLVSCTTSSPVIGGFDPYEPQNRKRHDFNKRIDSGKGSGGGVYAAVPGPARTNISNFANNIRLPSMAIQNVLQLDGEGFVQNTFRFTINSTLGLAGLFDPATSIGVPEDLTGFGQTLDVWGVGQGAYLELPVLGPSTERDVVGGVVDLIANPYFYASGTAGTVVGLLALIGDRLNDRVRYSTTIESILYDSEDSYAQSRLIYLQNRQFELARESDEDVYFDPYDDSTDSLDIEDPYDDPYADPYE
ncbi:MAG: VacJ family lipoprotein [Pseudoruegeria sp.]